MQLVFHTGVHATDGGRLIKCLRENTEALHRHDTIVPRPRKYRKLFREFFQSLKDAPAPPDAREIILGEILQGETPERILFSDPNFFGTEWSAIRDGQLYPLAGSRMAQICALFPGSRVDLCMGLRNPASFIPAILAALPERRRVEIRASFDLSQLSWAQVVAQVREMAPEVNIKIWCNEDSPLIWGKVLRSVAGVAKGEPMIGEFAVLPEVLSEEGLARFHVQRSLTPELNDDQTNDLIRTHLEQYAAIDRIEEELDLPGWTEEVVDAFTQIYDDDMRAIQSMPGVTFIRP